MSAIRANSWPAPRIRHHESFTMDHDFRAYAVKFTPFPDCAWGKFNPQVPECQDVYMWKRWYWKCARCSVEVTTSQENYNPIGLGGCPDTEAIRRHNEGLRLLDAIDSSLGRWLIFLLGIAWGLAASVRNAVRGGR